MHELKISHNYPNKYWLKYEENGVTSDDFMRCNYVNFNDKLKFGLNGVVSEKKILSYDFLFSDGPIVVSQKAAELLSPSEEMGDIQLIEASLSMNGTSHYGYKVLNILRSLPCIDMEKSESQPILSYLPDGPRKFSKVVLKRNVKNDFFIARSLECNSFIVISDSLREVFIENNIIGLEL